MVPDRAFCPMRPNGYLIEAPLRFPRCCASVRGMNLCSVNWVRRCSPGWSVRWELEARR